MYYMGTCLNKDYEETTSIFKVRFTARHFCRIFDKALLALIGRLAADEVGKTCLYILQSERDLVT